MADIRMNVRLPSTPKLPPTVYRLRAPVVSERSIRSLARSLGMVVAPRASRFTADAHALSLASGMHELKLYKESGGFRFIDRARWQVDDQRTHLDVSDAAASRSAQALLKRIGLSASAGEARFLKAARLHVGLATAEGREASDRVIDVAVAFQRVINKIPVDGPGGKTIVYLDSEGRATCIERLWRHVGAGRSAGLAYRSAGEAVDEMAKHLRAKSGIVTVEDVKLVYFEQDWRDRQDLLEPAYVIRGLIGDPDSPVRRKLIFVSRALAGSKTTFTPALRNKPAQSERTAQPG